MKLAEQYARTLLQVAETKDAKDFDKFFDLFIEYLRAHHHEKLIPQICKNVVRLSKSQEASNKATITVRALGEDKKFSDLIHEHQDMFGNAPQVQVDAHIVGGAVLRNRTHLVDASYRKALLDLYQTLKK
ncbi:MAG: F0F1 ATP synthase subunit delta [Patescibacteria group bacterium]